MKKKIAFLEILILILAIFSFAYLISERELVSAQTDSFKGCCRETKEGAICQDIPFFQADLCKENLFATKCSSVGECKLGCCYSSSTGTCSLRSPKQKCLENGGNWSDDISCNIPQCQLGCCILGNQVSLVNSRECTLLSNKYNFEKKFIPFSSGESCEKYIGLEELGACLSDSGDFSGEKNCVYTSKKNCKTGDFKPGYLCTSKELNTICKPTNKTTCVEDRDQVYFLDSCGNVANIYDSSKANNQTYWEKPIPPEESCSPESPSCGNCDYVRGSICAKYEKGKTQKPSLGDYVCKSLHCNNKKHGESWCVYDFNPLEGIAPVGSRHFIARCFEGQISIEGCADFMQEICVQNTDSGYTEAKCLINDWRSCLNANDAESYSEVEKKCEENPQCIMFNEFYGEDKLKRSDGKFLAGFDPEKTNAEQGAIDDLGKDQNKLLAHCVPRFTPGFQFWNTNTKIVGRGSDSYNPSQKQKQFSTANYGGSNEETNAICSLGSFTCISSVKRKCQMVDETNLQLKGLISTTLCAYSYGISELINPEDVDCDPWEDEANWECNIDGANVNIKTKDLPNLMSAMNERCRALGSCGVSSNIIGEVNEDFPGFSVQRIKIDRKGENRNISISNYTLPGDYIASFKKPIASFKKLNDLKSISSGLSADIADSAWTAGDINKTTIDLNELSKGVSVGSSSSSLQEIVNFAGPLTMAGLAMGGWKALTTTSVTTTSTVPFFETGSTFLDGLQKYLGLTRKVSTTVTNPNWLMNLKAGLTLAATAIIGSYVGYQLGKLIAKNQNWSPGLERKFIEGLMAAMSTVFVSATVVILKLTGTICGATGFINPVCAVAVVAAISTSVYKNCFDDSFDEYEYYIMSFSCEAWQPPKNGNCDICNDDVRPCSEYRCKSLGSNCHYFIEKGEPGYCYSISEIWKAKITPWKEVLTEGYSYINVRDSGFRIAGKNGEGIEAWGDLTFGIKTDKPATCRIDYEHTKSYDEMKFEMISDINPETGKSDGLTHKITLSGFLKDKNASKNTLGLTIGEENEYYIRCLNFAGQVNEAEFVVQVKVKQGPDLTPAELRRFNPPNGIYLKKGTNSTSVILYLNEPAECRFVKEYDVVSGNEGFYDMSNNMTCLTSQESVFLGEWTCFTKIDNLTEGKNTFYFRCNDQPNLKEETEYYKRNINFVSKEYVLNVCKDGLNISLLNRKNLIEEKNFTLSVRTFGCIGNAFCSYNVPGFSSSFINFFETGKTEHNQLLTFPQGNYSINVKCEDEARNIAEETFNFSVFFDETPPLIQRALYKDGKLSLETDEEAECFYNTNKTTLCNYELPSEIKYLSRSHNFTAYPYETYYIRCRDKKLNILNQCSAIIKPINL